MVRLDQTFSDDSSSGATRCAGCIMHLFGEVQAPRTSSHYLFTEIARYKEFFYTSSGWIDWTKPSLTTSLQGLQGVQGASCTSWRRFKHIEPHHTFSIYRTFSKRPPTTSISSLARLAQQLRTTHWQDVSCLNLGGH